MCRERTILGDPTVCRGANSLFPARKSVQVENGYPGSGRSRFLPWIRTRAWSRISPIGRESQLTALWSCNARAECRQRTVEIKTLRRRRDWSSRALSCRSVTAC